MEGRRMIMRSSQVLGLLALAALTSQVSQLTMAPVFGSIPSAVNHQTAILVTTLLGWGCGTGWRPSWSGKVRYYLAAWAAFIPLLQWMLFRFSGPLGPVRGPILIGFLSCHTIIIPSTYAASLLVDDLDLRSSAGASLSSAMEALIPALIFSFLVQLSKFLLSERGIAVLNALSPVWIQQSIALGYAATSPEPRILLPVIASSALLLWNPRAVSPSQPYLLDSALRAHNWSLVDRQWSNTGYISVLDNIDMQYRVLRCDHSLLGGEWLLTDQRRKVEGWKVNEPIYAVFEMLEAVRLMELETPIISSEAKALVVGLGIGTAPRALIGHGINTTIVELDPVVHKFAMKYFELPNKHNAVLQDAIGWVSHETRTLSYARSYDYIIHDVFTGGAEPLALFTEDFIRNLRLLLRSNGVIAINYAGDLSAPLTGQVLNTIDLVFEGQCRIFTDAVLSQDRDSGPHDEFSNIVVFCRNSAGPITFRQPNKADLLQSQSRKHYLFPRPEMEVEFPLRRDGTPSATDILKAGEEKQWVSKQAESAIQHWYIMRRVLPDAVWELY